jgi:hypothetical protein
MSHVYSHIPTSVPRHRACALWGLALLVSLGLARPAHAQRGSDPAGTDHVRPSPGRMLRFNRVEGPPAPAFMRDSIGVSGKELQQYTQQYDRHMAATKPVRDSVRISMQAVREAYGKGDREGARAGRERAQVQWKQLAEQDEKFEENSSSVLTKDQQTRYQQWKDRRKQETHDGWREHRGQHGYR